MLDKIDVLVVGSGAREHALAWKIKQSPRLGKLYMAPGNGGTKEIAENIPIQPTDINALADFAENRKIGLTVVSQPNPLYLGVVDLFASRRLNIFGPTKKAAAIEHSKTFGKDFMKRNGIKTSDFKVFSDPNEALKYVQSRKFPLVIKKTGLAFGLGSYVCKSFEDAEDAINKIMIRKVHGTDTPNDVLVEDFVGGEEISIHAISDGRLSILFPPARDYKPLCDGNSGPNTASMGSYAPVGGVSDETMREIKRDVVDKAIDGLRNEGALFKGCLFPGLKGENGGFYVLEYNSRFGDPETVVFMRLLKSDALDILLASANGALDTAQVEWNKGYAVCVVMASRGYPGPHEEGFPIYGIKKAAGIPEVVVFHAGTSYDNGEYKTSGAKVLCVSATGESLDEARSRAYQAVDLIKFDGMQFRRDIGK